MRHHMAPAILALLLAASVPAGPCFAASYQNGITTTDDVLAKLGQPDSFTLQPDGSVTYVYKIKPSPGVLGYFPVLGLFLETSLPDATIATFTFDASTRLTGYTET